MGIDGLGGWMDGQDQSKATKMAVFCVDRRRQLRSHYKSGSVVERMRFWGPDRLFLLSNLYLSRDIYFLFYPRSSYGRNVITVRRNANYKQKTKHKRKDHHSFLVLARSLGTPYGLSLVSSSR